MIKTKIFYSVFAVVKQLIMAWQILYWMKKSYVELKEKFFEECAESDYKIEKFWNRKILKWISKPTPIPSKLSTKNYKKITNRWNILVLKIW